MDTEHQETAKSPKASVGPQDLHFQTPQYPKVDKRDGMWQIEAETLSEMWMFYHLQSEDISQMNSALTLKGSSVW